MPLSAGLSPAARRTLRGAGVLLGALVIALGLHDAGALGGPKLDDFFNVWVYTAIELLVCALVLTRAVTIRQDRGAWLALGIGIAFYTAGDLYYTLFLENAASVPTPSPADAGYLLFYPFTYVALARLVGAHVRDVHASVWLDGAIGGLTLAALGAALVLEPVIQSTHGDTARRGDQPRLPDRRPAADRVRVRRVRADRLASGARVAADPARAGHHRGRRQHLPVPRRRRHLPRGHLARRAVAARPLAARRSPPGRGRAAASATRSRASR